MQKLSDCGSEFVIESGYRVKIEDGDYLIIEVGATVDKASARITHPNIIKSAKRVYEFKHYLAHGRKKWTSKAGISHFIVVPKSEIYLIQEKGYSYVKAEINGVKVSFNVCGGGGETWTDLLSTFSQISVNHKASDIKKICDKAVRNSPLEEKVLEIATKYETEDINRWNKMAEKASPSLKKSKIKFFEGLIKGEQLKIFLKDKYLVKEGIVTSISRKTKKVQINDREWEYVEAGNPKYLYMDNSYGNQYRVRMSQIDWVKTIKNFENSLIEA